MSSHNLTGKGSIQTFVQNILHCECPPDIFSYISISDNYTIYGHKKTPITINKRINIGHRLLVYLLELNSDESIQVAETRFPEILEYGKFERDSAHFNRFRVALVASHIPSASIEAKFQPLFSAFLRQIGDDPKIHLHFV